MSKELRCSDVFKECGHVVHGQDIRTIIALFMSHVREVHRVTNPTPELRIQVMTAVREVHAKVDSFSPVRDIDGPYSFPLLALRLHRRTTFRRRLTTDQPT